MSAAKANAWKTMSAGNLDLASNPFYREFDKITLIDAAKKLPGMQGSGAVRDLQEAASLAKFLIENFKLQQES